MKYNIVQIALNISLNKIFDYRFWHNHKTNDTYPKIGQLVTVPFNNKQVIGLVIGLTERSDITENKLKDIITIQSLFTPVSIDWLNLCRFIANYYQRPFNKVALLSLPKSLRTLKTTILEHAIKKLEKQKLYFNNNINSIIISKLKFNPEKVVQTIITARKFMPFLLHELNGNNKIEFYCHVIAEILTRQQEKKIQILILVPEIHLLLQIESILRVYFTKIYIAILHSSLKENERIVNWLAAHQGLVHIVLGTGSAILASLSNLKLIIVDEEHNIYYKQKSGPRYSARDLAVWRAYQLHIPIILGSATPSPETWQQVQRRNYYKIELYSNHVTKHQLPIVQIIDIKREKLNDGLTSNLFEAIKNRLSNHEQSLLFLNRRGYATMLVCKACNWMSKCKRCTSFMVLHKIEKQLHCHYCNLKLYIPKICPICNHSNLQLLGQGTQYFEKKLQIKFPKARILRIDADLTNFKNVIHATSQNVYQGKIDILIGTQIIINRYNFKCLTLIGIINPDIALFSHNYRASEYLFTQLMQIANQANKNTSYNLNTMLIQSQYPNHFLYHAIKKYNYLDFITELLQERQQAILPPFIYQAILRAEASTLKISLAFLNNALNCFNDPNIIINDPTPIMQKTNMQCAQLLIECKSRSLLQIFLRNWVNILHKIKTHAKWSIEVDPIDVY